MPCIQARDGDRFKCLVFGQEMATGSNALYSGKKWRQVQMACIRARHVFHDRLLIMRCFWSFVLPVLEYCSAVWCSAADTHLKLLDRVVRSACFLAGGVLNCNLSHRRSVELLCMLYKIWCNPLHPLCGALPVPYVPVRVTRGALIAHRYTYAPPRCRTCQYRRTFILLSVSL